MPNEELSLLEKDLQSILEDKYEHQESVDALIDEIKALHEVSTKNPWIK